MDSSKFMRGKKTKRPQNPSTTKHLTAETKEADDIPVKAFRAMNLHPNTLRTQDIHFTQASVSETFTDGTTVANLTTQLLKGALKPQGIEPIRIVHYRSKWMSLDNRRLRAFKDAFIEIIPVTVCDLSNDSIKREFHSKRSNKSSESGGTIRSQIDSKEHFDDGPFVFTKRVLNWNFEQLKYPLPELHSVPLPLQFNPETYYFNFLNLILEETRASLQAGVESAEVKKVKPVTLSLIHFKSSNNAQNPSTFKFFRQREEVGLIKANDAFILQLPAEEKRTPPFRMIALASAPHADEENQVKFKVVVEQDLQREFAKAFLEQKTTWEAIPIGTLVTHLRMYDICTAAPKISWLKGLCTGQIENISTSSPGEEAKEEFDSLNLPQREVVGKFLALQSGIQLAQGPPGTGKTTTIVTLLKLLAKQKQRVLVCASSNNAVQILVERFIDESPNTPIILAGVEDKLPEGNQKVRSVFIHTWGMSKLEYTREMREQLWELTPDKLFSGTRSAIDKNLAVAETTMQKLMAKFKKFRAEFHKYGFKPTSSDNFKLLKTTMTEYLEAITKDAGLKTELDKHYSSYNKINCEESDNIDSDLLEKFSNLRRLLSICVGVFNNLELRLQSAIANDTKQGLEGILLDHSLIIFATLSVSGRRALKEMDAVDALVVDEAGQAVEAETLIPLTARPKKCLLVGDTKQLPATVISTKAIELKFDRSLMQRLEECRQPSSMLTIQFRMHTEIRRWPSAQYYQDRLTDSKAIEDGPWEIPTMKGAPRCFSPYAVIDVQGREIKVGHSYNNKEEADLILKLVAHLQKKYQIDVSRQVGIITFYKAQAALINTMLQPIFPGMIANTVDSFQGDENDVILISFVRAHPRGSVGFLADFRRLNVAVTRARYCLLMLGNTVMLEKQEHDVASLIKDARDRNRLFLQSDVEAHLKTKPLPPKPQNNHGRFFKPATAAQSSQQNVLSHTTKSTWQSNSLTPIHSADKQPSVRGEEKKWRAKPQLSVVSSQTMRESNNPLYKIILCRFFRNDPSSCRKGEQCEYAHGQQELRTKKLTQP